MYETKRQTEGIEFLRRLEEFVREREFPRRVIDSVVDMRQELEKAGTSGQTEEVLLQISDLLKHIGKKYQEETSDEILLPEERISFADIQERIEEILALFRDGNRMLAEKYKGGQSHALTELETNIREILHTQGHYKRLRNGGTFCNYMEQAERGYCARIGQFLQSCTEDLCQNCDQAMIKMKGLFTHIKDERYRVSQRRIYQEYDSRYDMLRQRIKAMAAQLAGQQNAVSKWAAGCVPFLVEIKKQTDKKRNRMLVIPLLFLLAAIVSFKFVMSLDFSQNTQQAATEATAETAAKTTAETEGYRNEVIDYVIDKSMEKGAELVEEKLADTIGTKGGNVSNWVIYAAVAAYVLYTMLLIKRAKRWYCEAVGNYLAPEVARFLAENTICKDTEEKFETIHKELETGYQKLIQEMLSGGKYEEQVKVNSEAEQFQILVQDWKSIQRLA